LNMSELAFNVNGEGFEVPSQATGWRVRRMKQKGAPEVVYGRDGLPLVLPIHAEIDDLRQEVATPGRYRLDPVDDNQRQIADSPSGYVVVHADAATPGTGLMPRSERGGISEAALVEAMRMNTELARSVIDRFPAMMDAAAVLLRAADGAGLPARAPVGGVGAAEAVEEAGDDDADGTPTAPAAFDLNALVAQVVPHLVVAVTSGRLKVPGLGAMLDWRKAAPGTATSEGGDSTATTAPQVDSRGEAPRAVALDGAATAVKVGSSQGKPEHAAPADVLALEPAAMAHFLAVQRALTLEERALAQGVASELAPAELRAWLAELARIPVPAAVAKIREVLRGKVGGHTAGSRS
jgi:hypothetical protein